MTRPTWNEIAMTAAEHIARMATCPRRSVGAALFDHEARAIVSLGFNGAPHGAVHCNERPDGCRLEHGHCADSIHAEINSLLAFSAPIGFDRSRLTLYATHRPCRPCSLYIAQFGVKRVVYRHDYDAGPIADDVFRQCGVMLRRYESGQREGNV